MVDGIKYSTVNSAPICRLPPGTSQFLSNSTVLWANFNLVATAGTAGHMMCLGSEWLFLHNITIKKEMVVKER